MTLSTDLSQLIEQLHWLGLNEIETTHTLGLKLASWVGPPAA
jgi:hypothetical protein